MPHWIHTAFAALSIATCLPVQAGIAYRFTSPAYTQVKNFTPPCGPLDGHCQTLPEGERVRGYFVTAAPLPANLSIGTNSYGLVSDWKFSNGTIELTPSSPGVRVLKFQLATNDAGEITDSLIEISRWTDGAASGHVTGERVEYVHAVVTQSTIDASATMGRTVLNGGCTIIISSTVMPDTCLGHNPLSSSSTATYPPGGVWEIDAPRVSIGNASASEAAGSVTFTVSLSDAPDAPVSVNWHTLDDSAAAGSDYTAASGTLTWPQGNKDPQQITITLRDDALHEPDKTFSVQLDGFTGIVGGASTTGVGTIVDDDTTPSAGNARPVPALSAAALALLSVTLSAWGFSVGARKRPPAGDKSDHLNDERSH